MKFIARNLSHQPPLPIPLSLSLHVIMIFSSIISLGLTSLLYSNLLVASSGASLIRGGGGGGGSHDDEDVAVAVIIGVVDRQGDDDGGHRALADVDDGDATTRAGNPRYRSRVNNKNNIPPLNDDDGSTSDKVLPATTTTTTQDGVFLVQEIELEGQAFGFGTFDAAAATADVGKDSPRHRTRANDNKSSSQSQPTRRRRVDRIDNIELPDGTIYQVKNARSGWSSRLTSGRYSVRIPRHYVSSADGTIDLRNEEWNATVISRGSGRNNHSRRPRDSDDRHLQSSSSSIRTVLVVRVILDDAKYTYADPTRLSNDVFGNGVDMNNLKSQYAACSSNQLLFDKIPDRRMSYNPNDGGTTDITNGVVDIKVPYSKSAGDGVIRNAVTIKLNSVFGVSSPVELANHVMYCLPSGTMAGIAYAYINSWNSVYSNEWCNYVSSQMHEIGHNLGYGHSNELGPYADQTGMMGYSYGSDDYPRMCFNAAKSWQSTWYTSKSIVVDPSSSTTTTTMGSNSNCFEGNLYGIVDYGNAVSSVVLIKMDDSSTTDYFVAFNRKSGFNADTVEAGNEVTVVRAGGEGYSYSESELLAKLKVGMSWSGSIDGKTMVVNVLTIDIYANPAYATVRISENGNPCLPANIPIPIRVSTTYPPTESPTTSPTIPAPPPPTTTYSPITNSPTSSPSTTSSPSSTSEFPSVIPTFIPTPSPSFPPTPKPSSRDCRQSKGRRQYLACIQANVRSKFKRLRRK